MNRREAIIRIAVMMGATVVGPRLLRAKLQESGGLTAADVDPETLALLDEIGETIIPATDIPGAKAVQIGAFIAMMVRDCYEPDEQAAFKEGLGQLAATYEKRHGHAFVKGSPELRTAFLNDLDLEQRAYTLVKVNEQPDHYFRILKELTIVGYYSSEIGCTQALRYIETPGSYQGSVPYKKGDLAWFS